MSHRNVIERPQICCKVHLHKPKLLRVNVGGGKKDIFVIYSPEIIIFKTMCQ